jgi:hypothetical protein
MSFRFSASLLLCLAACSPVTIYRGMIEDVRRWKSAEEARAETQDLTGIGLRAEFSYDRPAVKDRQPSCAALMSQQHREADACEGELHEMGDGCKIPGACPNCEAMVQTVAQYKADRCVL